MRRIFTIALVGIAASTLAAESQTEPARNPTALEQVTLVLDWVSNVNHVGFYVARELGFFEDQGLDVRIIEPGEVYAASAVMGGQAEFGVDFQENVTLLRSEGVPIVSIAAIVQTNTSGFAVRAEDNVKGPADFEDRVYGTFNSPYEEPTLSGLVRCAGGDPATISYVTAGTDLLAMLDQGLADVVWIYYATQGFQAERLGIEIDYFPLNDYQDCIPDYYSPVLVASEATLARKPDTVRRFLAAVSAAHGYVRTNPGEAAQILSQSVPELDEEELSRSVPWLAERMFLNNRWGDQTVEVWESYAAWMASTGVFSGEFQAEDAFTTEFLPNP